MKKNPDKIITAAEFDTIKSHDDLFEEDYRLNYSTTEHVNGIKNIKNNLIRSCLQYLKIKHGKACYKKTLNVQDSES